MEDYAEKLRMTIPEVLAWCEYGEGGWWLSRLKVKWQIQAAAHRQETEARAAGRDDATWRAKGYHGGYCDPREFSSFDDEETAA